MIAVTYHGTAFGGKDGNSFGCAGVFSNVHTAIAAAMKHRDGWIKSHAGVGLRPIRQYTHIPGDGNLEKTDVSACGGWGDSLYINYKFENVKQANITGCLWYYQCIRRLRYYE